MIYSPDLDTDPRVDPELRRLGTNRPTKSYLAVPLVCLGRVIGVLQVDSVRTEAFDDEDMRLLQGLATQVAGAIESARHNEEIRNLERLKADFLARVSHELRTPLTIIAGFAETLATHDADIDDEQREPDARTHPRRQRSASGTDRRITHRQPVRGDRAADSSGSNLAEVAEGVQGAGRSSPIGYSCNIADEHVDGHRPARSSATC